MLTPKLGAIALWAAAFAEGLPAESYSNRPRDVLADLPLVTSDALEKTITSEALLRHSQALEDFAYRSPGRNRLMGTQGHNDTVTYLYNQLSSLNGYYNTTLQQWSALVQLSGSANFTANGQDQGASVMDYSPSGSVTAPLVAINNLGCNATDYPPATKGSIAIISRGVCRFDEKSVQAGLAGAVGAVIYDNIAEAGSLNGSLGLPTGGKTYVPTAGFSLKNGTALVNLLRNGTMINGTLSVRTVIENQTTYNVIAQTVAGDQNNVLTLGAHTDSVAAGPGINDDGSGTAGILESAIQLSNYSTKNAVRFGFWSGEEEGLLGSSAYVAGLTAAELAKIRLYLNFDMIASPNFQHAIYDGDGSDFNNTGPQGSAETEHMFEKWFTDKGLNFTSTEFDGRSDYGPFLAAGVACGGTSTGAEANKTEEDYAKFGGQLGEPYDKNYHQAGDNVTNLNMEAFLIHSKAIAHSIGVYSTSFDSLGQNVTTNSTVASPNKRWFSAPIVSGTAMGLKKPSELKKPSWRSRTVRKNTARAASTEKLSEGVRLLKRSEPLARREELLRRPRTVYEFLQKRKAFA